MTKKKMIGIALSNISVSGKNGNLIRLLGTAINTETDSVSGIRFSRNAINSVEKIITELKHEESIAANKRSSLNMSELEIHMLSA